MAAFSRARSAARASRRKEKSVRDVEARLEAERRLTEELRQEVALLKDQERDARSDADALRTGLDTIRDGAARLARRCDDLADAAKKQRDDNAKAHRVRELEVEVARLARELKMARAETARAADGAAKRTYLFSSLSSRRGGSRLSSPNPRRGGDDSPSTCPAPAGDGRFEPVSRKKPMVPASGLYR